MEPRTHSVFVMCKKCCVKVTSSIVFCSPEDHSAHPGEGVKKVLLRRSFLYQTIKKSQPNPLFCYFVPVVQTARRRTPYQLCLNYANSKMSRHKSSEWTISKTNAPLRKQHACPSKTCPSFFLLLVLHGVLVGLPGALRSWRAYISERRRARDASTA